MIGVRAAFVLALSLAIASPAVAEEHYALIVSGASGGEAYAKKYDGWRDRLATTLTSTFGYPSDHVVSLREATRGRLEQAVRDLRSRVSKDDLLFIALIGHGTGDKINLVGPDMTASDLAAQLSAMPGRLVVADMTSSSFPFLRQLAAPGRIVVTATASPAQEFETVFPEFFIAALSDPSADRNKDGRVSLLEAFAAASAQVRTWFDQHNRLPTERALLDDDGDGVGREAPDPSPDGAVAAATYLQPRAVPAGDETARREAEIESQIEALKVRRSTMSPAAYDAEMERLLTELARLSSSRRAK